MNEKSTASVFLKGDSSQSQWMWLARLAGVSQLNLTCKSCYHFALNFLKCGVNKTAKKVVACLTKWTKCLQIHQCVTMKTTVQPHFLSSP